MIIRESSFIESLRMLIREFICVLEHGLMLFHVSHASDTETTDKFLRSSLISALYSFATQVEEDTLETLQLGKVTFVFRKQDELIFILIVDTSVIPDWCAVELQYLQQEFFTAFPEVQWQRELVLDLQMFDEFKLIVQHRLKILNKRVGLLCLLNDEHLLMGDDSHQDFTSLGTVVASRLLQKYYNQLIEAFSRQQDLLSVVDRILDWLDGSYIAREDTTYFFDCQVCGLCQCMTDCFFEPFLDLLLTQLGFETHVEDPPEENMKYLSFE